MARVEEKPKSLTDKIRDLGSREIDAALVAVLLEMAAKLERK